METFKFRAFLDTNVLLDVLCKPKRPSADASATIFQAIRTGIFEGFITTQSLIDAAYILSRLSGRFDREAFGQCVLAMTNYLNINAINVFDIRNAIIRSDGDLEDDAQFAHAEDLGCDAIITSDRSFRQRKDDSGPQFFTPESFVARLRGH
jgi:predicted nucleic acid-binding protein